AAGLFLLTSACANRDRTPPAATPASSTASCPCSAAVGPADCPRGVRTGGGSARMGMGPGQGPMGGGPMMGNGPMGSRMGAAVPAASTLGASNSPLLTPDAKAALLRALD